MSLIGARLEGGPFDGAAEDIDPPAPNEVVAWQCPRCGSVHINDRGPQGAERYVFDHQDGPNYVYIYGDLDLTGNDIRERDLIGA